MEAIIYSTAIIVVNFLFTITFAHLLLMCFHTGMRLRVATCSLIYRKVRIKKTKKKYFLFLEIIVRLSFVIIKGDAIISSGIERNIYR